MRTDIYQSAQIIVGLTAQQHKERKVYKHWESFYNKHIKNGDFTTHEIVSIRTSWQEGYKAAQQSVQRIAFGAFSAGVLVGAVIALIVMFVQIGVR